MKIINLIRSEFIKNYNLKKVLIVFIVLTISSIFLVNISKGGIGEEDYFKESIEFRKKMYNKYLSDPNKNFQNNYNLYSTKNEIDLLESITNKSHTNRDWKLDLILSNIVPLINENYLIDKIINTPNEPLILEVCNNGSYINSDESENYVKKQVYNLCSNYSTIEMNNLYFKNNSKITELKKILNDDKYYLYVQYMIDNKLIESDKFTDLIINKKLESNISVIGYNYEQYKNSKSNAEMDLSKYESTDNDYINQFSKDYKEKLKNDAIKNREIVYYSSLKEIPHDISYHYDDNITDSDRYMNTKIAVNQVFHLSAVIMIIVSITSSGIISSEHSKGTIKNLVTTPIRRWKILLSKFIYLILNSYLLWILGLVLISIIAGIKYGFTDLITPKLVWNGSKVIEVNYYLYLLKDIFIASIPIICFLSILFFLSSITLNTSLTVGITTTISVLSPIIWLMSIVGSFKQIVYIPIWYFDLGFIFNNSYLYNEPLRIIKFGLNYGISICLITTIILYLITNIVYIKRDIKN